MCPIRAEILSNKHWEKCFYFVICVISRHWFQTKLLPYIAYVWRIWGKNVIFRYIQKYIKTKYIYKHSPPPVFQNTTYIIDVYLYTCNKQSVKVGSWNTRGTMFYRLKMGEGRLTTHEIRYSQREMTPIISFVLKALNFA